MFGVGDNMEYDLIKLKNHLEEMVEIDTTCSFQQELLKETDLIDLKDVTVKGDISYNVADELSLHVVVSGVMVLPCAITLKEVEHPFRFEIDDSLETLMEEIDEKQKNIGNSIDIFPIIWENILMEIPMRVVHPDAKDVSLEGDGWKLISGDHKDTHKAFEKLDDLFKKEEV